MLARLNDGSIAVLEKDCSCHEHSGPHWVYVDRLRCEKNRELLGPGNRITPDYIDAEQFRIRLKRRLMKKQGIVDLLE